MVVCGFFFLCVFSHSAQAIVDIESLRERAGNASGGSAAGSFEASGDSGNSDSTDVNLSGLMQYRSDGFSNLFVIGSEYGKTSGNRSADEHLLHIRHSRVLSSQTDWEGFYQQQQNEFTRLEERILLGSGIRLRLMEQKSATFVLGIGGFYESEQNEGNATKEIGRSNVYLSFRKKTENSVLMVTTVYLQNKLDEFSDQRAVGGLSVSIPATSHLDFIVSINVEHDSRPPTGIEKTDWTYKTGIGWKF